MKKIVLHTEESDQYSCFFTFNFKDFFYPFSEHLPIPQKYVDFWGKPFDTKSVIKKDSLIVKKVYSLYFKPDNTVIFFKKTAHYVLIDKKYISFLVKKRSIFKFNKVKRYIIDLFSATIIETIN